MVLIFLPLIFLKSRLILQLAYFKYYISFFPKKVDILKICHKMVELYYISFILLCPPLPTTPMPLVLALNGQHSTMVKSSGFRTNDPCLISSSTY